MLMPAVSTAKSPAIVSGRAALPRSPNIRAAQQRPPYLAMPAKSPAIGVSMLRRLKAKG